MKALRCAPEVIAADVASGPLDVVAVVQGKDTSTASRIVLTDKPVVDDITHTTTCLVMNRESEQSQCGKRLREVSPLR